MRVLCKFPLKAVLGCVAQIARLSLCTFVMHIEAATGPSIHEPHELRHES